MPEILSRLGVRLWLFPGCGEACGLCRVQGLGARASAFGVWPAGGLQWRFACGFGFGHGL